MSEIRRLIQEIHRRSLWQVLGIFLAASWAVLQVVELLTDTAGLPDWTPTMALVLLMLGLPICLATAFVQEGMPGRGDEAGPSTAPAPGAADDEATPAARRLLTWRNAILGGVGAFALLGFSLFAYFVMWTTGVGPVGNLVAQGVIEAGGQIVLADFDDATGEGLGEVVTEALRVDLSEASVIRLAADTDLGPTLELMRLEPGAPLPAEVALDAATRAGIPAVIDGAVSAAGTGYLVTATLRASNGGRPLATFRASAGSPDEIIASIDKLSQDIRERSGESLRDIRAGAPLEQVTTSSLEALRLYSAAEARFGSGDWEATTELLREAVEIDPAFAMAWRKLAAAYGNQPALASLEDEAATKAFENRERLTDRERYLAEAYYYARVRTDAPRAIASYQALLELEPDHAAALNNLANVYNSVGDRDRGITLYRRAVDGPGSTSTALGNLILGELSVGRYEDAASSLAEFEARYPDASTLETARFHVLLLNGARSRAAELAASISSDPTRDARTRSDAALWLAKIAYREGRWGEGREQAERAVRIAAQTSPEFESDRHFWAMYIEAAAGDPREALARARTSAAAPGFGAQITVFKALTALVAAREGDHALAREILSGERVGIDADDPWTRRIDVLARAYAGQTGGAVAEMEALREEEGCLGPYCWERERAEVAALTGDAARAIPLYASTANRGGDVYMLMGIEDLVGMRALGPLYEQVGDTTAAIDAYQRVVTMWSEGDGGAQQVVRTYRTRIEALGGGR